MSLFLYQNDLPDTLDLSHVTSVAIDTETTGLRIGRDRLCLVQLCFGDNTAHLVQFRGANHSYDAPNLKKLLSNPKIEKLFHFARFDIAALEYFLKIRIENIFCTKVAAKLVRTFTNRHGLRDLARDLIGVEISKQQQTSDWGTHELSQAQCEYAAGDVLYLHQIKSSLNQCIERENRKELAQECFNFLPTRARLDILGFEEEKDFFAHS